MAAKEFCQLKKEAKAVDEESEWNHKICVVDPIDLANSMEKATEFEFYYDEMTCDIQRMCVCTDASSCIIRCTLSNPKPRFRHLNVYAIQSNPIQCMYVVYTVFHCPHFHYHALLLAPPKHKDTLYSQHSAALCTKFL